MSLTVNHVHTSRNAERLRLSRSRTREQCSGTASGTPLNEQAESTILATISVIVLASLSVCCLIGIGVGRMLGGK